MKREELEEKAVRYQMIDHHSGEVLIPPSDLKDKAVWKQVEDITREQGLRRSLRVDFLDRDDRILESYLRTRRVES